MEKVINLGIPHIAELVFESIDTLELIKCLDVSQTWRELAGNVLIKRWKGKWQSKWFKACKSGKTKFVQLLLAVLERCKFEEIDLNVKDTEAMTGFMWACQDGQKYIARGYLERTGLMIACDYLWIQTCC